MIYYFIYSFVILLIVFIPYLSDKNKVRLSLLTNNTINKLLLLLFLLFIILEDYTLGVLVMILYFIVLIQKIDSNEGFQNYFI